MKAKIFSSRTLALILVLAMAVSLFTISASAATTESLSGHGSNISSLVVTGADFESVEYATSTDVHGTVYDYYLAVPTGTADGTALTATFTAADGQPAGFVISANGSSLPNPPLGLVIIQQGASNTYTATLADGVALATAYAHKDINSAFGKCDTYRFHYYMSVPVSISTGDPVFIAWNGTSGTVAGRNGSSNIPGEFTLWVDTPTSVTVNGVAQTETVQNGTNYGYTITTSEDDTLSIVVVAGGVTYTISCGVKSHTQPGSAPTSVVSYLPIGQFANNSAWGVLGSKFAGKTSLDSTGISLGAFGGFAEFYFKDGITNNEKNPYGVDFVIYGNAFNGNPEAGAVQVSEDGSKWYELAGSNYYDGNFSYTDPASGFSKVYSGTLRNTNVVYTNGASRVSASLGGRTAKEVCPTAWFPQTDKYTAFANDPTGGAHTDANVNVNLSGNTLTFTGITAIADSDTTADYAFGYADVTPNGSPNTYGDAVNPYTPYTSDKTGGDGFDLEWAVDIATGLPVDVTGKTFHYVRVYSAVLDFGRFGETSTEICGIFTTANKASANVGRSSIASLTINDGGEFVGDIGDFAEAEMKGNVAFYDLSDLGITTATIEAVAANSTIYMNNTATNAYTITANTEYVRVIVQTGEKAPYIAVIKL